MKKYTLLTFLAITFTIVACGNKKAESSTASEAKTATVAQNNVDGEKIYKMQCVACHGMDGKLGVNGSKDLTASELTLEERITMIKEGKPPMMAYKNILEEDEIKAVAEYTFKLK